ncbi:MAG: lysophospholipid acyltransferase family protein [Alphaproteobacteria bacterium]|nr:lysophospholipid acyltransferase family protein [Alphaproteobacteria bacterium]
MIVLRSIAFNVAYILGSFVLSVALLWALVLPRRACVVIVSAVYGGYISFVERWIMGLRLELRGLEHLPDDGRYIIAAKHQSAYETLKLPFMRRLKYPVIILKKELSYLPVWGLYPWRMGLVPIDRSKGTKALRDMSRGCKKAVEDGRPVAIFPQGTRVAPGVVAPYKAGLGKIYKDLGVPIVPMALNSGVFWGRNAFLKKPGTVVFEFLPPIPADLPPLEAMAQIESALEEASDKLVQDAAESCLRD